MPDAKQLILDGGARAVSGQSSPLGARTILVEDDPCICCDTPDAVPLDTKIAANIFIQRAGHRIIMQRCSHYAEDYGGRAGSQAPPYPLALSQYASPSVFQPFTLPTPALVPGGFEGGEFSDQLAHYYVFGHRDALFSEINAAMQNPGSYFLNLARCRLVPEFELRSPLIFGDEGLGGHWFPLCLYDHDDGRTRGRGQFKVWRRRIRAGPLETPFSPYFLRRCSACCYCSDCEGCNGSGGECFSRHYASLYPWASEFDLVRIDPSMEPLTGHGIWEVTGQPGLIEVELAFSTRFDPDDPNFATNLANDIAPASTTDWFLKVHLRAPPSNLFNVHGTTGGGFLETGGGSAEGDCNNSAREWVNVDFTHSIIGFTKILNKDSYESGLGRYVSDEFQRTYTTQPQPCPGNPCECSNGLPGIRHCFGCNSDPAFSYTLTARHHWCTFQGIGFE